MAVAVAPAHEGHYILNCGHGKTQSSTQHACMGAASPDGDLLTLWLRAITSSPVHPEAGQSRHRISRQVTAICISIPADKGRDPLQTACRPPPPCSLTVEDLLLGQPLHIDAARRVLPQLQIGGRRVEQIRDGLVVDLEDAAATAVPQAVPPLYSRITGFSVCVILRCDLQMPCTVTAEPSFLSRPCQPDEKGSRTELIWV